MDRPEVQRLYKYRAFDAFSLSSLVDQTGWFATPVSFNDPFDCRITLADSKVAADVQLALEEIQARGASREIKPEDYGVLDSDREAFARAKAGIAEATESIGVFCLSELSDHILMWSHYANCHRGFCIEYGRQPENSLGTLAEPVLYSDEYPELGLLELMAQGDGSSPSDVLWRTKSSHWSYEREWRIVQHPGGKPYALDFPITAIIFGMHMPDTQRLTIYNVVSSRWPAVFRQATRSNSHFRLEISGWSPDSLDSV